MAGFVALSEIKAFVEVFVDAEDFEFPDTMDGLVAFDVERQGQAHFRARFGVLEDIRVSSPEAESMSVNFDRDLSPGAITIDGPGQVIDGALAIGQVAVNFAWQDVVDLLHDDEDEVEEVCHDNTARAESCRVFRDQCRPACNAPGAGGPPDPADVENCLQTCRDNADPDVRDAYEALDACIATVPECTPGQACEAGQCEPHDQGCLRASCGDAWGPVDEVCSHRDWCEEIRTPAPEAPDVEGLLSIVLPGASGGLRFTGADDVIALSGLGLGEETLHATVHGDRILGVDLNPEHGRRLGLSLTGRPNDNFRLQVTP